MILNPVSIYPYDKPAYKAPGTVEGAQLANFVNNTGPSSATLSNTAAGYTTLGGQFQFVPVTGAETDYALFGYQVPMTHRLWVKGISIAARVATAVAATLDTNEWGIGINSTAVSLATADSDPAFGPRRIALGHHIFAASAAAGTTAADIVRQFLCPLRVEPSRFFHVILRRPTGATTGLIRGDVAIDGFFEKIGQ